MSGAPPQGLAPTRIVQARPIDRQGFAAYGALLTAGVGRARIVNGGRALRFDGDVAVSGSRRTGEAVAALYSVEPSRLPFRVEMLERHPFSTQTFVPMQESDYLVAAAPERADGLPDLDRLDAFIVGPGTGVHYARGVWHLPLVALDRAAHFAMWIRETGEGGDTVEFPVEAAIRIDR